MTDQNVPLPPLEPEREGSMLHHYIQVARQRERQLQQALNENAALLQNPVHIYNHQVQCNASQSQPFGCPGCSCRAWKAAPVDENAALKCALRLAAVQIDYLRNPSHPCPSPETCEDPDYIAEDFIRQAVRRLNPPPQEESNDTHTSVPPLR